MSPSRGVEAVARYLAATGDELGWSLETVALYEDMVITERIGRVMGDPAGRQRIILSLVRVRDGRITSWQDFYETASSAFSLPRARRQAASAPEHVAAR